MKVTLRKLAPPGELRNAKAAIHPSTRPKMLGLLYVTHKIHLERHKMDDMASLLPTILRRKLDFLARL